MMTIMLFNQSDNLYENGLSAFETGFIVTPSPQMADIIRRKIAPWAPGLSVITISKFLRDELSALKGEEISENYRGKSELLLLLSTLWKKLEVPDSSYELFQRCFRVLTDLRSFSMSDDVLETALEHFDEKIAYGTLRMHQVLNQLDIYDEHRSYFQLSEQLRSGDIPITYEPIRTEKERNLIFFGFDFLSASQVDLLKSYAIRDNVVLPVYKRVYESLLDLDWLSWLDGEEVLKEEVDEERELKRIPISSFPKNYLSKAVKETLAKTQGKGNEVKTQIVLGERHSSFEKAQQVNLQPSHFKSPVDIIGDKIHWLMEQIPLENDEMETQELKELVDSLMIDSVEKQDFRELKALQLMGAIIEDWRQLSEDNERLTSFDLKILKEALSLDAPRVFQTALSAKSFKVEIKSLKELDDISRSSRKIICVASDFSSPKGNLVQYTEGVEKYLASIGPLRRAELEFVALKEKLADALDEKSLFLVEEGILERDQGWKSFFDLIETEKKPIELNFQKKAIYSDPLQGESLENRSSKAKYSATKLQTYIDCPRKYLFKYVLKLAPDFLFTDKLDALELGRIQHGAIETYVNKFSSYVEEEHEGIVDELLLQAANGKNLDRASYADHKLETIGNTKRAIIELLRLKSRPGVKLSFEQSLSDGSVRGSVDCVIETENDILLLDFKRGAGSLPSQSGFKAYEKIQLWFYANHYQVKAKNLALGYICLSDLESSLLFFSNDNVKESFKGIFEAKPVSLSKNFEDLFLNYQDFEKRSIARLESDEFFAAKPLKSKVCDYCELNKLCPRTDKRSSDARS